MGFQGSMVMTRENAKEYVVLSSNQSVNLMSGGHMSCNKDSASFWSDDPQEAAEPGRAQQVLVPDDVTGKDMDEWVLQFVQREFFAGAEAPAEIVVKEVEKPEAAVQESRPEPEAAPQAEEQEVLTRSVSVEVRPSKAKKSFKVFRFVKNAIKKHIKK